MSSPTKGSNSNPRFLDNEWSVNSALSVYVKTDVTGTPRYSKLGKLSKVNFTKSFNTGSQKCAAVLVKVSKTVDQQPQDVDTDPPPKTEVYVLREENFVPVLCENSNKWKVNSLLQTSWKAAKQANTLSKNGNWIKSYIRSEVSATQDLQLDESFGLQSPLSPTSPTGTPDVFASVSRKPQSRSSKAPTSSSNKRQVAESSSNSAEALLSTQPARAPPPGNPTVVLCLALVS